MAGSREGKGREERGFSVASSTLLRTAWFCVSLVVCSRNLVICRGASREQWWWNVWHLRKRGGTDVQCRLSVAFLLSNHSSSVGKARLGANHTHTHTNVFCLSWLSSACRCVIFFFFLCFQLLPSSDAVLLQYGSLMRTRALVCDSGLSRRPSSRWYGAAGRAVARLEAAAGRWCPFRREGCCCR